MGETNEDISIKNLNQENSSQNEAKKPKPPQKPNPFLFHNIIQDEKINPFLQPEFPAKPILPQKEEEPKSTEFNRHKILPPLFGNNNHKNNQETENKHASNNQNVTQINSGFKARAPFEQKNKPFVRNYLYFRRIPLDKFKEKAGEIQSEKWKNTPKPASQYTAKKCHYRPSFKLPPMEEELYIIRDHDSLHSTGQLSGSFDSNNSNGN